jgi:hypothetical protein
MMEVRTWNDLAAKVQAMSPEQRQQPIQCVQPTPSEGDVQEMLQGIAIATVAEFGFYRCRSTHDNKYNASDVVLLMDYNPFAKDGAVAYELSDGAQKPIYGKDGPTPREAQYSPQALADQAEGDRLRQYEVETIRRRVELDDGARRRGD